MDKYIEVFCKQNPKFALPCGNPECGKEHAFNSKDVFRSSSFDFKCDHCGNSTHIDSGKITKDLIAQIKKLGIKVR